MTLSVLIHICPPCKKEPSAHACAAALRSASCHIIAGALPPSSNSRGLRLWPHMEATIRPTIVEPVKFTFFINGLSMMDFVTVAASEVWCAITLRTPGGRPASESTEAIAHVHRGENSGALSKAVLPAARAYTMERIPRIYGAFLSRNQSQTQSLEMSNVPWSNRQYNTIRLLKYQS